MAVLPLENLSGDADAADRLSRMVHAALGGTGTCALVDVGEVDAAMTGLRIRTVGMMTSVDVVAAARELRADWLMSGTILEHTTARTPEGEVPSVGLALRLLDGRDARVAWTAMAVRTGDERETIFGWGRETSLHRLAERVARELVRGFRIPAAGDTTAKGDRR